MERNEYILNTLGIEMWSRRSTGSQPIDESLQEVYHSEIILTKSNQDTNALPSWDTLQKKIHNCQLCSLARSRTKTVFGSGSEEAKLIVIGEAPGYHEDKQGKPFVGRAGQLLTEMLKAIGIYREDVFIANVLKCRPPNNRDPLVEEVSKCTPYLQQQIAHIGPSAILALGRVSAQYLLKTDLPMRTLRGQRHYYTDDKIPLLVTYHPAYLLRSPKEKAKAFADLLKLKHYMDEMDLSN